MAAWERSEISEIDPPIGTLISYLHVPGRLLPTGWRFFEQPKLWGDEEDDNPYRPGSPAYVILEKYK